MTQALFPSVALLLLIHLGTFQSTFRIPTSVHSLFCSAASPFFNFASHLVQNYIQAYFCEMEFLKGCDYLT